MFELAKQLGAEQLRIGCKAHAGLMGGMRKAWDVLVRGRPPIELEPLIDARELVVVGGPVWDSKAAPPVLSALRRLRGKSARVALFVTCDGRLPTCLLSRLSRRWPVLLGPPFSTPGSSGETG